MCGPEDPLFTPLLPLARIPFQAKESVHKTPFWENLEILACTASIFTQILAHKPPNLEIFSSQAPKFGNFPLTSPPFQRQMSVRKPHTSEIRAAHPYLKKSWVPPPPPGAKLHLISLNCCLGNCLFTSERLWCCYRSWIVPTDRGLCIIPSSSELNYNGSMRMYIWGNKRN